MSFNVQNCIRCGRLIPKGPQRICRNCLLKIEEDYQRCRSYLKENPNVTIRELSEAVDVPVRLITRFIQEGRISVANFPNLKYPCSSCGTLIQEDTMCPACRNKLADKFAKLVKQQGKKIEPQSSAPSRNMGFNILEYQKDHEK